MEELLRYLSAGGGVGVWILIAYAWQADKKLTAVGFELKNHCDLDEAEFKRVNARLRDLEDAA